MIDENEGIKKKTRLLPRRIGRGKYEVGSSFLHTVGGYARKNFADFSGTGVSPAQGKREGGSRKQRPITTDNGDENSAPRPPDPHFFLIHQHADAFLLYVLNYEVVFFLKKEIKLGVAELSHHRDSSACCATNFIDYPGPITSVHPGNIVVVAEDKPNLIRRKLFSCLRPLPTAK